MKLLVVTQKVDKKDPILGFFHAWIVELASRVDSLTVVCLYKGEYDLPKNVTVHSLGKEEGVPKISYIFRFYKYVWKYRKMYSSVFVHMNEEYILLAGILWRMLGKKILLWRNHPKGSIFTRLAVLLSHKVFCTSPLSFTAKFKKTSLMPVGIDTKVFYPLENIKREPKTFLYVGRLAPVKNIELIIEAVKKLIDRGIDCCLHIYGDALQSDISYKNNLLAISSVLMEKGKIVFFDAVSPDKTPLLFNKYFFLLNTTTTGSFDKVMFEHMACGGVVLTSNTAFKSVVDEDIYSQCVSKDGDIEDFASKMQSMLLKDEKDIVALGNIMKGVIVKNHSLSLLVDRLVSYI